MDKMNMACLQSGGRKPDFIDFKDNIIVDDELSDRVWFNKIIDSESLYIYMEGLWNKINANLRGKRTYPYKEECSFFIDFISNDKNMDFLDFSISNKQHSQYSYLQYSPLFSTIGAWLTGTIGIAHVWKPECSILLDMHALMLSSSENKINLVQQFKIASGSSGLVLPDVFTNTFVSNNDIEDYAFKLPVFLMGVGVFPSFFYSETLGVNMAMAIFLDKLSSENNPGKTFFNFKQPTNYSERALQAIDVYCKNKNNDELGCIIRGFECTWEQIKSFINQLKSSLADTARFSNKSAMLELIARVGPYGFGYHKKGKLGEKDIDSYLSEEDFSPESILKSLAESKYIRPGHPDKSIFMKLITQPNGGMFGIFTPGDLKIISNWIESLSFEVPGSYEPPFSPGERDIHKGLDALISSSDLQFLENASCRKYSGFGLRTMYQLLLETDLRPDIYPAAKLIVQRWLASHQRIVARKGLPFSGYTHSKLNSWFKNLYRKQVDSYIPLQGTPKETKHEVIADAVALAPLTMIDGAWLRNVTHPARVNTYIGGFHYQTLLDELGLGDVDLHHGNIYKGLLESMGVKVADFTSQDFCESPLFQDEDFEVPVFWLAISLFPQTYFPETLGLNLAMELSGVGGEYRRSGDILRYYGFSSLFVDLHNTVDNVVTGHSAWAIESIRHHLDDIFQQGGAEEREKHWHRVWVGYQSLNPPEINLLDSITLFIKEKIN